MIDKGEPLYSIDANQVSGQRKKELALCTSDMRCTTWFSFYLGLIVRVTANDG
jgi:hypothetical protein